MQFLTFLAADGSQGTSPWIGVGVPVVAALLALVGALTTMYVTMTNNRRQRWWEHTQRALDKLTAGGVQERMIGLAMLTALQESSLAKDDERVMLGWVADLYLNPAGAGDAATGRPTPTEIAAGRLKAATLRKRGEPVAPWLQALAEAAPGPEPEPGRGGDVTA